MKAALSLVALASSALGANIPRGYGHGGGHVSYTTEVIVTYTTVCGYPVLLFVFRVHGVNKLVDLPGNYHDHQGG